MAGLEDFVTFQLAGGTNSPVRGDEFETALAAKYSAMQPVMQQFSPSVTSAIQDLDRDRISRGQEVLPQAETYRLAQAAQTKSLQTPAPKRSSRNVIGNALRDVRNIVTGIPQMPMALAREVTETAKIPEHMAKSAAEGMNPVAAIATAPGVRMLPGAYIAGNLAQGKVSELIQHPVFTALDVLPGANKLAKGTASAKLAASTLDTARSTGTFAREIKPIKAAAMYKVLEDSSGAQILERNALGKVAETLAKTPTGRKFSEVGGQAARRAAQETSTWNAALMQALKSDAPIPKRLESMQHYITETRAAGQLFAEFTTAHGPEWVADTTARMKLGDVKDFTPEQHDYSLKYRGVLDRMRSYEAAESVGPMQLQNGEWYDRQTAGQIIRGEVKARRLETNQRLRDAINQASDRTGSSTLDPLEFIQRAKEVADTPLTSVRGSSPTSRSVAQYQGSIGKGRQMAEIRGWLHAAEAQGLDVDLIRGAMKPNSKITVQQAIDQTLATPSRIDPAIVDSPMKASRRKKYVDSLKVNDKAVERARTQADKVITEEIPSRFVHPAREKMIAKVQEELENQARVAGKDISPEALQNGMRLYYEKRYADAGLDPKWIDQTSKEVAASWQKMKEDGIDPIWVHDIPPSRVQSSMYPRVTELPGTPSQSKKQFLDARPTNNDAFLALNEQGMQWVKRFASEQHIESLQKLFGKSRSEVYDLYRDKALRSSEFADPRTQNAYLADLERKVSRDWAPFNPIEHGFNWDSQALRNMADADILLPREVVANLKRLHDPSFGKGLQFLDPVMKTFRISVLPLSPNWHMGNVIGNAISTAVTNPRALLELPAAYNAFKFGTAHNTLPEELLLRMGHEADQLKVMQYGEGKTMLETVQAIENQRFRDAATAAATNPTLQKGKNFFNKVVDTSFDWNQRVDQFFRAANYIAEEQRLTKLGKSADAARAGAIDLASRVLPDFAALTPLERQVFRYVFPFYSWTQHILRLTANLPFDHPSRTAIMSSLTRAELEDLPSGFSESFLGTLPIAGHRIALGSWNPFGKVADNMTLIGFLGGMNPLLNVALEQAGVVKGQKEAYPTLRYDPQSGKMRAIGPGVLSSLAYGMVPQLQPLANLAGIDSTYSELNKTNPADARKMMLGAFGVPAPLTTKTDEASIIANERAVHTAMSQAASDALKTGNFSRAKQFPALIPWVATVQAMAERGDFARGAEVPPIPGSAAAMEADGTYTRVDPSKVSPQAPRVVSPVSRNLAMGGV